MNTRCYNCGRSFTLNRDAIEAAVVAALSAHEKTHVEHCPHCRRVIKIPVEQLRRALPGGWTPPAVTDQPALDRPEPVAQPAAAADTSRDAAPPEGGAAQPGPASAQAKSPTGKTAAEKPAARKSTRKQPKP
jgi:hypothetical protein